MLYRLEYPEISLAERSKLPKLIQMEIKPDAGDYIQIGDHTYRVATIIHYTNYQPPRLDMDHDGTVLNLIKIEWDD